MEIFMRETTTTHNKDTGLTVFSVTAARLIIPRGLRQEKTLLIPCVLRIIPRNALVAGPFLSFIFTHFTSHNRELEGTRRREFGGCPRTDEPFASWFPLNRVEVTNT
jgi:hypothetical protein